MKKHPNRPAIVLIHFAGGNCYSFQFLKPHLGADQLVVLELPGRGRRIGEPLISDIDKAVDDLLVQFVKQGIQDEFVLYGHSMGATLALLLCEKLEARGIHPACLIATGSCGPGAGKEEETYKLRGEAFKNALRKLGGISETVLQEEELFEYFEPVIRADFELLEKSNKEPAVPLRTPIHVVMGAEEEDVAHIENWQRFTTAKAITEVWKGNHFFIHDCPDRLAGLIKEYVEKIINMEQGIRSSYADNA